MCQMSSTQYHKLEDCGKSPLFGFSRDKHRKKNKMEAVTPPLKTSHIRDILEDTEFIDYLLKVFRIESDHDTL